jgi:hypothetical protein
MALDYIEIDSRDDKNTASLFPGGGVINGSGLHAELDYDNTLSESELVTALKRLIEICEERGWRA